MAIATGCLTIAMGNDLSKNNFIRNKKSIPANKGSVGKNISMGKSGMSSDNGIESGTKNTNSNSSLSIEKKAATTSNKAIGKILNKKNSL